MLLKKATSPCCKHWQEDFERAADPNSKDQQELVAEMKAHLKKVCCFLKYIPRVCN